jgi:enterochelin esterase-like enzyme
VLSRRALLVGTGATLVSGTAVGAAVWGVTRVGTDATVLPQASPGPLVRGAFFSQLRQTMTNAVIAYPPGSTPGAQLPVLVSLHGRGGDAEASFAEHQLQRYLAQVVEDGTPPFAIASVDGGTSSYWHKRGDGSDAARMVVKELLPRLTARGLDTSRFAIGGWSMGGYGALLIAENLGPTRIAAVVVDSPAVWTRFSDTPDGAFDSEEDFRSHDVLAGAAQLSGVPVRVTCGLSDPLLPGARALLARLPKAERQLDRGGHDVEFWQHVASEQLAFAGRHLA